MDKRSIERALEIMSRLLRPVTHAEMAEVSRRRADAGIWQLTLADAGLEDEVRELLAEGGNGSRIKTG